VAYGCINLHREMWRGRHIHPEHLTENFESHVVSAVVRLTARGFGVIAEFWRDSEVIATDLLLVLLTYFTHIPLVLLYALYRPPPHVPIALVGSLLVVVVRPLV
jgi:hypothetical protein